MSGRTEGGAKGRKRLRLGTPLWAAAHLPLKGGDRSFATADALWPLALGLAIFAALWLGPLPERAQGSFFAHMIVHMGLVALAAPLLALGLTRLLPRAFASVPPAIAVAASILELVVVWAWHAPALHDAARVRGDLFLIEQGSFLAAGTLVWASAIGTAGAAGIAAKAAGVVALLLTSMHMTLLGALLLFSPRALYACATLCAPSAAMTPLGDQQAGGALMLSVGGLVYLVGGLALLANILSDGQARKGAA